MADYIIDAGGRSAKPAPEATFADLFTSDFRSVLDNVTGVLTQKAIGARKGLATVAGLPMDLAATISNAGIWAANKAGTDLPYIDKPWLGSENIDAALAAPGRFVTGRTDDPAPRNTRERISRRVSQEVGGALVPAAGVLGAAARVGLQGLKELSPFARMFVEPAATAPRHFISKELAVASGVGANAGGYNEVADAIAARDGLTLDARQRQAIDMFGALQGFGLSTVGARLRHATKEALGTLSSKMQRAAAEEAVRKSIRPRGWLGNEAATAVDDGELKRAVMK